MIETDQLQKSNFAAWINALQGRVMPSSRKDDSSDEDSEDDTPLCQVSKKPKPEPPKPAVKAVQCSDTGGFVLIHVR